MSTPEHVAGTSTGQEPVAIVGVSCLLPGADSPEQFWANLRSGADLRRPGGREVFGTDETVPGGWGDPEHRVTATRGGFVTEPTIDLTGLRIPAETLGRLDKVVRWPLHTARRALADAGIGEDSPALARTGVVLGNYAFPTESSVRACLPLVRDAVTAGLRQAGLDLPESARTDASDADPAELWPFGLPATVLADALGLGGARLTLDAACSSALYALYLARGYLVTGQADVMLAGAVCAPDPLLIHLSFSDLQAFPANGTSQPFDARSAGIVTGQGTGIFVLKRLADARRDGDTIHAVLGPIGLSNDGAGGHLLTPRKDGQMEAYQRAYLDNGLDPAQVDYIECHATGTPLGDGTELRGVAEFFTGRGGVPLLGSVKGNVGHLLTVAGFTSMLKAILALRHGTLPATPGVEQPLRPADALPAADRVVRAEASWPAPRTDRDATHRVAAVSAFGFGGINAHAVLTTDAAADAVLTPKTDPAATASEVTPAGGTTEVAAAGENAAGGGRLALVGLGLRAGPVQDVAAWQAVARTGTPALVDRPEHRWYGLDGAAPENAGRAGYAETVDVDARTYRIPPGELDFANPQHLLLFEAAEQALADAGYDPPPAGVRADQLPKRRVAVVVAMEMEPRTHTHRARFDIGAHVRAECARAGLSLDEETLARLESAVRGGVHDPIGANEVLSYIGSIMASRISSSRNLVGPSFTVAADATSGARALEVAQLLLLDPTVEAVVVGGVDLAGGVENVITRAAVAAAGATVPPVVGDSAAVVVVTRPDATAGRRVYATVESVAVTSDPAGAGAALAAASRAGLAAAGRDVTEVDYLELASSSAADVLADLAGAWPGGAPEGGGLVGASDDGDDSPVGGAGGGCVIGGAAALVGETQQASVLTALVNAACWLHRAELPATPVPLREALTGLPASRLEVSTEAMPWLRRRRDAPRVAAVAAWDTRPLAGADTAAHLVVAGADTVGTRVEVDWRSTTGHLMLAVSADDATGMTDLVRRHRSALEQGRDPWELCREAAPHSGSRRFTAVLVAADGERLRRELDAAERDLPAVLDEGGEWATPAGSFCTGRPVGEGRVAFVYPGAFTSYPGVDRDLFRLFPGLLERFEAEADRPRDRFKHRWLYPRGARPTQRRDLMRHEERLIEEIPVLLATGTNTAVLRTQLLRDVLGIVPQGGFGYSLGESSMLFAMDVWAAAARDDAKLAATPLFRDRLRGPKHLVRETWSLPADTPDSAVWASYVLLAGEEPVRAGMAGLDRVFLTHVNTPREVVVGGDPAQVKELIRRVGCQAAKAPANHVMHCPVVDPGLAELAELNRYPAGVAEPALELLSAFDNDRVDPTDLDTIAERIAWTLRSTIDFAQLTRTAYDRGFRFFVEVGPGATCARWIGETLAGQPHVAVSVDRRGVPVATALAQALARLASHGLPVDLGRLLGGDEPVVEAAAGRRLVRTVPCGGESIVRRVADRAAEVLNQTERETPTVVPQAPEVVPPAMTDPTVHWPEEIITVDGEPFVFLPPAASAASAPTATSPTATPTPATATSAPTGRSVEPPDRHISVAELTALVDGDGTLPTRRVHAPRTGPQRLRTRWSAGQLQRPAPNPVAAVEALAGRVAEAHRAALRAHHVIIDNAVTRLELSVDGTTGPGRPGGGGDNGTAGGGGNGTAGGGGNGTAGGGGNGTAGGGGNGTGGGTPEPTGARPIWDEADLLEFASGQVAKVFGPDYAEVDSYPVRTRLPEPPYLFVTRVTELTGRRGVFEPSTITTEYDVPVGAWYSVDGLVPCAVTIEAGQCDLLLISYLGIDLRNKGERVYRLLDSTLVFHGPLPREGQTLRYDISINRFVWNNDALLFFFSYKCYADGELILELLDACAGYFNRNELDNSLGVILSDADRRRRAELKRTWFKPLARTDRAALDAADLELLSEGRRAEVFGPAWEQGDANRSLRLPAGMLRMIDEIPQIDRLGGPCGLGELTAVKRLTPDGWYFTCHFPGDPVLAGSLVAEGGVQLLQTYAMYLGMHLVLPDAEFQSVPGLRTEVKVRGQITPETTEIRYHAEIIELTMLPRPTVIADLTVYVGDKPMVAMRNFGVQIREKPGAPYRPGAGGIPEFLGRRNALGETAFINELHLAHAAKGDLGTAMGPEFDIYRDRRAPHIPNGDFQFVDRIMSLKGERGVLKPGAEMVTEYDSPPEAWYYADSPTGNMPNCVLMETSLQAAILCGYYLGATLAHPDDEFAIRNLDGKATLVKDIDLAGRTIRQHTTMLSSQAVTGATLQSFRYELSADGEVFYVGESMFGYFVEAALANQVGLDSGQYVAPWLEEQTDLTDDRVRRLPVRADQRWRTPDPRSGLRLGDGHLELVDEVTVVTDGGRYGRGYLLGTRVIDPADWYFTCHFHRDPVMPGSLGVESVIQGLQAYVIEAGLADDVPDARFASPVDVAMGWKYRGQILRTDREMTFDLHVKEIRREADRLLVVADASVWKPGLRIYELTDVAVEVRSGGAAGRGE
ncbi:beta-ketoacyl synthase N-terminal-like domain-containing protein [Micromonospora sp. WMMD882]|uniref:beta-ketoacyl synthase N-terminal-like domain-containing protein n=1 Tax=Micromonospora sp. WMMD882 TaxID=3015151 RepID=UPI00248B037B|nr:beta-ketoacyl synthase N-terminal-like domain-containing protein [Micromonospora sp. WMMD882]WBB78426.1 beta-ketoacyl synthase N-terminal-like domain-containing protein [Micromonospora sp. WMMD882]